MRILNYAIPRALRNGTTPVGTVLTRLALFLGISVAVYLIVWLVLVYFVARLLGVRG